MNPRTQLEKCRQDSLDELLGAIRSDARYERLLPKELEKYKEKPLVGWKTTISGNETEYGLNVLIPDSYPDDPPIVYLDPSGENLFLKNPHVEESGKICIISESTAIDADLSVELFYHCIESVTDILTKDIDDDFLDEFTSYWSRSQGSEKTDFYVVDPISDLSVKAVSAISGKVVFVGASYEDIRTWIDNKGWPVSNLKGPRDCIVVKLPDPLHPSCYPKTINDLRKILKTYSRNESEIFDDHLCNSSSYIAVLLTQKTPHGEAVAGVLTKGLNLLSKSKLSNGFRVGKIPKKLLLNRATENLHNGFFARANVQRVDHEWIHTRGGIGAELKQFKVCILGCGSLGSYVTHLLAKAGVGNLILVDPQSLVWANVGRHYLGADCVGEQKAEAMKAHISKEMPHLNLESITQDWRTWVKSEENPFDDVDLIVSTIADWRCERTLNILARKIDFPPVVFGWMEPFAMVGHALTVIENGGCLACGMSGFGMFENRVISLDNHRLRKEPGGCAYYQEYGPLRLMKCATMIADTIVNQLTAPLTASELTTIITDLEEINTIKDKISASWSQKLLNQPMQHIFCNEWKRNPECSLCSM